MPQLPRIFAATAAMLALSTPPAIAAAPVELAVDLTAQLSTVTNASAGSGWSRLTINADHKIDIAILRNHAKTDTGVLAQSVSSTPVARFETFGTWVARGTVAPGKPYVTTIATLPTRRYTIIVFDDPTVPDGTGNNDTYSTGDWLVPTTPGGGEPPATAASITLTDRSIRAVGLSSSTPIKVTNAGRRLHELTAYPVAGGAKAKAALRLARRGLVRQVRTTGAPVRIMGLVGAKTTQYLEPKLKPGTYVLACGEGNKREPDRSHAALGQATIAVVT